MKIVYILSSTDPYGGATKSFMALLAGMLQKKHSAIVVVPDRKGIFECLCKMPVEVVALTYRPHTWTYSSSWQEIVLFSVRQIARLFVNWQASRKLCQIVGNRSVDVIHTNVSVIHIGSYLAKKKSIPHVYHYREYGAKDFGIRYFPTTSLYHHKLVSETQFHIAITKDIWSCHNLNRMPLSKVIYNGVLTYSDQIELNYNTNYFLYAGRIEQSKGIEDLLNAYGSYIHQVDFPLPLYIAGHFLSLNYERKIKSLVHDLQIEGQVRWLGNQDDMCGLYRNARALIVPSLCEGFGRSMPEAMSCGCLVIGHNTGGTKEQFDNGYLYKHQEIGIRYSTVEELTAALVSVHQSREHQFDEMRMSAFYTVNEFYSIEKYVDNIESYYIKMTVK